MTKTNTINVSLLFLLILAVTIAYFYSQNKTDIHRISNNVVSFSKYPSAEIIYLGNTADGIRKFKINYSVNYLKNSYLKMYVAPVIAEGKHQDAWTQVRQFPINSTKGSILFDLPNEYVFYKDFWLMVNVQSTDGTNDYNCTGNPTYTSLELSVLGLTSCGEKSYIKIFDKNSKDHTLIID